MAVPFSTANFFNRGDDYLDDLDGMNEILLQIMTQGDTIDLGKLKNQIQDMERKQLLEKHPYTIWKTFDGKWCVYLPDGKGGRLKRVRKTREEVENVVVRYQKSLIEDPTLEELYNRWSSHKIKIKRISLGTINRYTYIFYHHFSKIKDKHIKSFAPEDWVSFLEEQPAKFDMTSKSFSNLKIIVRGMLKFAKRNKYISYSDRILADLDTTEINFKKVVKEDNQEVFTEDETPVIINYLKQNLDAINVAILLLFVTGMRVGEVVTLKKSDIQDGSILIRRTETIYRKQGEKKFTYEIKEFPKSEAGVREIAVPYNYDWLLDTAKSLNPDSEFLFTNSLGRLHSFSIRERIYYLCDKLDIVKKSPHKIRKTYASILLDNGLDNRLIIDQMGHTSVLTTEKHYHRSRRNIEKKREIVSGISEFAI